MSRKIIALTPKDWGRGHDYPTCFICGLHLRATMRVVDGREKWSIFCSDCDADYDAASEARCQRHIRAYRAKAQSGGAA